MPHGLVIIPLRGCQFINRFGVFPYGFGQIAEQTSFLDDLAVDLPDGFLDDLHLFRSGAFFEFRAVAEADYLPLHLLQLLFRHLVQIAEDDIPVDGVLQFVEIKFGQRLVTLSGQHPFVIPVQTLFRGFKGIFPHDGQTFLLVCAVFLVIVNPGLQVLLLPFLVGCIEFLRILLVGDKTLLGRVVFHGLPFLGRGLHTPFLFGLVHFLEGVTLLLVDLRERLVKLLPCKGLAFPYTFPHDRYACRLKFLLCPDTGVGKLVLIIPGRFARILGFPAVIFLYACRFKPLLPFLCPRKEQVHIGFGRIFRCLLFLFQGGDIIFSELFGRGSVRLSGISS